jgi:hypothetical protein
MTKLLTENQHPSQKCESYNKETLWYRTLRLNPGITRNALYLYNTVTNTTNHYTRCTSQTEEQLTETSSGKLAHLCIQSPLTDDILKHRRLPLAQQLLFLSDPIFTPFSNNFIGSNGKG